MGEGIERQALISFPLSRKQAGEMKWERGSFSSTTLPPL